MTCPITTTAPTGDLTVWANLTSSKGTSAWKSVTLVNALTSIVGQIVTLGATVNSVTSAVPAPPAVTYYGTFQLAGGTFTTGTPTGGYVTIAALRNGGAANVVAVQLRRAPGNSGGTLRLQVNGATAGTYALANVATTTYTITIKRFAGQPVQLLVNGVVRITGPTAAVGSSITSTVLGYSGSTGTVTVAGAGSISNFASNRFTP